MKDLVVTLSFWPPFIRESLVAAPVLHTRHIVTAQIALDSQYSFQRYAQTSSFIPTQKRLF